MEEIIVYSQKELDDLPLDYNGRIYIKFGTPLSRALVKRRYKYPVAARENSFVEARGNSQVTDATNANNIKTAGNARIVYSPRTAEEYAGRIGAETNGHIIKLYKAVHKRNGRFFSDQDSNFEYIIGQEAAADYLNTSPTEEWGHGIYAAYKEWCVGYGRNWADLAILEVEMDVDGLVVPLNGPGKVRAAKCKVIREVPLEECGTMGKLLAKRR